MPRERQDNITAYDFSDYTGGINVALPPMQINSNEAQMIINMEYEYTRLRSRGGISTPILVFENNVLYLCYDKAVNRYIVIDELLNVLTTDLDSNVPINTGKLNGTFTPSFCKFDGNLFIASGSVLQYIDYSDNTLKTLEYSKNCDNVFERNGRLVTTMQGDDNQYYSAIGDPYSEDSWKTNSNDESSSQWIEIGYKDDGDITTSIPLSQDLFIFKTNGRVYDLTGDTSSWSVSQVAENAFAINKNCILQIMNNIVFLTQNGLKNLATTQTYGNFSINEIGYKFNALLTKNLHNPKMWNLTSKRQLVIRPNSENAQELFVYQYNMDSGFLLKFNLPIVDIAETQNGIIIVSGNALYRWSFDYATDNGEPIEQQITTRQVLAQDKFITRRMDISLEGTQGEATIRLCKERFKYQLAKRRKIKEIYTNSRYLEVELKSKEALKLNAITCYAVNV